MTAGRTNDSIPDVLPKGARVVVSTVGEELDAYDALPEQIREAIRHQPHEVAVKPILRAWLNPNFLGHLDDEDRLDAFVARVWRGE